MTKIVVDGKEIDVPGDYSLLQGLMVVFASCVIVVNLLTDLVYGLVDPRVKYQ